MRATNETPERDARALQARVTGVSYQQIVEPMGYPDAQAAKEAVERALVATPREDHDEALMIELIRIDMLIFRTMKIVNATHYVINPGRGMVIDPITQEPLVDNDPNLRAIAIVKSLSERRAKLLGLDSASRHEILSLSSLDATIAEYEARLGRSRE